MEKRFAFSTLPSMKSARPSCTMCAVVESMFGVVIVCCDRPDSHSERYQIEKLIRLSRILGCYQAPREELPVAPLPAIKNGYITFGCLNNPAKITPGAVEVRCQILHAVPNSRLILLAAPGGRHLNELFVRHGIDPAQGRIELAGA